MVVNSHQVHDRTSSWSGRRSGVCDAALNLWRRDSFTRRWDNRTVDEECDLNYAVGAPVKKEIQYAMSNSLGFGGHNATLLVKEI